MSIIKVECEGIAPLPSLLLAAAYLRFADLGQQAFHLRCAHFRRLLQTLQLVLLLLHLLLRGREHFLLVLLLLLQARHEQIAIRHGALQCGIDSVDLGGTRARSLQLCRRAFGRRNSSLLGRGAPVLQRRLVARKPHQLLLCGLQKLVALI